MTRNIAPFRGGERLGQRKMNDLRNAAIAQPFGSVPTGEGDIAVSGAAALDFEITALATEAPWELTCKRASDTSPTPETFQVEAPFTFYIAARGAVSYTYSSQNVRLANGTETQTLTPIYAVGDRLLVLQLSDRFIDFNNDGRQWAADPPP